MVCRIHIGHHFFGAGNLGDDLMLAGFLCEIQRQEVDLQLTCCIPHPRMSMQLRFPQIEWLPYESPKREQAISRSDVWLGLGDTPFQTVLGDWMLDHLLEEAAWCELHKKPMYYLAVGGDASDLASHPKVRLVARRAERIWTRDSVSAALLSRCGAPARVESGADLAHLCLATINFPRALPNEAGLVLNFEQREQASSTELSTLVRTLSEAYRLRWLAQEVRPLRGSELSLHGELSADAQRAAPLVLPDYAGAPSVSALLQAWGSPSGLLTSRYHAALIGAWAGWRTLVFPRSEKVRAVAEELDLCTVPSFSDAATVEALLGRAGTVPRGKLWKSHGLARTACTEFFASIGA